jgi:integrase
MWSGSWRALVYAGKDPLTGREIWLRKTCTTERDAQIGLGKLLALARAGRQPDSDVTVAQLLDRYVQSAGWDLSTREATSGASGGPSKPALGSVQVRKVRGLLLNTYQLTGYEKPGRQQCRCVTGRLAIRDSWYR